MQSIESGIIYNTSSGISKTSEDLIRDRLDSLEALVSELKQEVARLKESSKIDKQKAVDDWLMRNTKDNPSQIGKKI